MKRIPTAAALAILLVTAGIAGVVSAEPNGTDHQTTTVAANDTSTDRANDVLVVDRVTDRQRDDAPIDGRTFEQRLVARLAHFDLTDAEVREIVTEASRLEEAGASRLVVRSSIVMNLFEFGVDAPFLYGGSDGDADRPGDGHDDFHRVIATLEVTPEQARELHAMVHRMMDAGASREEIRRAIAIQLDEWEIDRPTGDEVRPDPDDARPDGVDRLVHSLVDRYDLDRWQAAELERLIRGMLDSGAHRGEIREAVSRLLGSYGVDDPTPAGARLRR